MDNPDNSDFVDGLKPWEVEVLGLEVKHLFLQAQVKLHQALLEKLLASSLQGRSLQNVYANELDEAMSRCLAEMADADHNRVTRIIKFMTELKRRGKRQ